jgi:hypothetical protein
VPVVNVRHELDYEVEFGGKRPVSGGVDVFTPYDDHAERLVALASK